VFAVVLGFTLGADAGVDFTTAWLLEKSLSVDNLFVFALIFGYFNVPRAYQHRVLFFGVIGALVFRGIFLAAGVAIVSKFTAVLFVFAAILLYSAYKLLKDDDDTFDPGTSVAVRLLRKIVPVREEYEGTRFFVTEAGKRVATPLLAVVVAIEAADLVFAWTASLPCSPSATTRSSSTPATPSPFWACERCTSCSLDCWSASTTCPRAWPSSWRSSASSSSCRPATKSSVPPSRRSPPSPASA